MVSSSSSTANPATVTTLPPRTNRELPEIDWRTENRRHQYLEWLYARSGRTCSTYSGLYQQRTQELLAEDFATFHNTPAGRQHLSELELPLMTYNALRRAGYTYVDEIADFTEDDFLRIRQIGLGGVSHILDRLERRRAA